jgi:hypothetical protein
MTTYTSISNGLVAVGAKPFATTIQALRDNPIAIAEGDSTAPVNQACWHPYDMVFANDGATGLIYNGTVQASITTPTMADGYDYMVRWVGLSHNSGSARNIALDVGANLTLILESSAAAADTNSGTLTIDIPTLENSVRYVTYTRRIAVGTHSLLTAVVPTTFATAITSMTFDLDGLSGSFDAGQVFFYRRRNYISG